MTTAAATASTKTTTTDAPSLEYLLGLLGTHVHELSTCRPTRESPSPDRSTFGLLLYTCSQGPYISVDVEITPCDTAAGEALNEGPWGAWATVIIRKHVEGKVGETLYAGNRVGAAGAYASLCAPVLAWAAKNATTEKK